MNIRDYLLKNDVFGWLTLNESMTLYNNARKCQRGCIVEIGSFYGKSTIFLAMGSKDGYKKMVYTIDPYIDKYPFEFYDMHEVYTKFIENIKRYEVDDVIKHIHMPSSDALKYVNEDIELLFIDGSHDYDDVKNDFYMYYPRVLNKGVIIFHDVREWEGPKKLINELSNDYNIEIDGNIAILIK